MATASVILVVENNPDERESIIRTLDPDRFHVVGADNPNDAIAYADDAVDLVISELQSRELNGLELLRKWKERRPSTPFVLVADRNDVNSIVEAMKLGAADCLLKPVDSEKLRTLVTQPLGTQRHQRARRPAARGPECVVALGHRHPARHVAGRLGAGGGGAGAHGASREPHACRQDARDLGAHAATEAEGVGHADHFAAE